MRLQGNSYCWPGSLSERTLCRSLKVQDWCCKLFRLIFNSSTIFDINADQIFSQKVQSYHTHMRKCFGSGKKYHLVRMVSEGGQRYLYNWYCSAELKLYMCISPYFNTNWHFCCSSFISTVPAVEIRRGMLFSRTLHIVITSNMDMLNGI